MDPTHPLTEAAADRAADAPAAGPAGAMPALRHPRDLEALVLARINQVHSRKDDLTLAVKGLAELTQQLARAYAQQALTIERLVRRVKLLEAAAAEGPGRAAGGAATPAPH